MRYISLLYGRVNLVMKTTNYPIDLRSGKTVYILMMTIE